MNKVFSSFVVLGSLVAACSSGSPAAEAPAGAQHLRIDMACAANTDCPAGFECETESENGTTTSFCESEDEVKADGTGAQCPVGFEREEEHGSEICKPHGGDDHGSGGAGNDGDSANSGPGSESDDSASGGHDGGDHDGGDHDGEAGSDDGAGGHDGGGHGSDDGSGHGDNSGHG